MATRDTASKKAATSKPAPDAKKAGTKNGSTSDAVVGFEEKLWQMADKLRNNMDAAEYKHVVLGLIFLKYISDAFEEKHAALTADKKSGADPEDPDEYRADNIFWVPKEARWSHLQGNAKQATVGKLVDDAMVAIEAQGRASPSGLLIDRPSGKAGQERTRLDLMAALEFAKLHSHLTKGTPKTADDRTVRLVRKALQERWGFRQVRTVCQSSMAEKTARPKASRPPRSSSTARNFASAAASSPWLPLKSAPRF